jgi:hypothetical protein
MKGRPGAALFVYCLFGKQNCKNNRLICRFKFHANECAGFLSVAGVIFGTNTVSV